jgi:hypothetical protein
VRTHQEPFLVASAAPEQQGVPTPGLPVPTDTAGAVPAAAAPQPGSVRASTTAGSKPSGPTSGSSGGRLSKAPPAAPSPRQQPEKQPAEAAPAGTAPTTTTAEWGFTQRQEVLGTALVRAPALVEAAGQHGAVESSAAFEPAAPILHPVTHVRLSLAEARALRRPAAGGCAFRVLLAPCRHGLLQSH